MPSDPTDQLQSAVPQQNPNEGGIQQAAQSESASSGLRMMPVGSSTLKLVGYDQRAGDLHIQFKSGPMTYIYHQVPAKNFGELLSAKSKGLYHANQIKGKFKFSKQKPVPPQL
jgi:hypothetical protein